MLEKICEKYGKAKAYWALACFLIIFNIFILIMVNNSRCSFTYDGEKFKLVSKNENVMAMEDSHKNRLVMTDTTLPSDNNYGINIVRFNVTYNGRTISYDGSDMVNKGSIITMSNGEEYVSEFPYVYVSIDDRDYRPLEVQLISKVIQMNNEDPKFSDYILPFIITCISVFMGLGLIIYPEEIWEFQNMCNVVGGEPTDWAIFSNKFGGWIIIIIAEIYPIFTLSK